MSGWWFAAVASVLLVVPTISHATGVGVLDINARVPGCGDGIIDSGEACDGGNLGGASCPVLGFGGGTLACTSSCTFATSSCTAVVRSAATASRTGGGAPAVAAVGTVVLMGRTAPGAEVQVQLDGIPWRSVSSDVQGDFQLSLTLSPGRYRVGVRAKTTDGSVTALTMIPVSVVRGLVSKYETIRLSPTAAVTAQAGVMLVSGAGIPGSLVIVELLTPGVPTPTLRLLATTSPQGTFVVPLPNTIPIDQMVEVRVRYDATQLQAAASVPIRFSPPGSEAPSVPPPPPPEAPVLRPEAAPEVPAPVPAPAPPRASSCDLPGDVTGDCAVTILDVMVLQARRASSATPLVLPPLLSTDGTVSLTEYSVMAYFWTG
jgi:hypothetical protein